MTVSSAEHLTIDLASIVQVPHPERFRTVLSHHHQGAAEICLQGTEGQYRELLTHMSFQLGVPTIWKVTGTCNQPPTLWDVSARPAHEFTATGQELCAWTCTKPVVQIALPRQVHVKAMLEDHSHIVLCMRLERHAVFIGAHFGQLQCRTTGSDWSAIKVI